MDDLEFIDDYALGKLDEQSQSIIRFLQSGLERPEIMQKLNINKKTYNQAIKNIKEALN